MPSESPRHADCCRPRGSHLPIGLGGHRFSFSHLQRDGNPDRVLVRFAVQLRVAWVLARTHSTTIFSLGHSFLYSFQAVTAPIRFIKAPSLSRSPAAMTLSSSASAAVDSLSSSS